MKNKLRIAVNTRLLLPGRLEGLGRFTCESLKRITRDHPEHDFIFIFDREPAEEFIFSSNVIPVVAHPQARHPLLWYMFFEWGVPQVLKKYKADLFVSPDGWLSLRSNLPSLAVIHDLNFFHNPQWVDKLPLRYYNYFFPRYIQKASRLATVSEFSREDIASRFKVNKESIDVVYNGANESLSPLSDAENTKTREQFSESKPYFLFLGLVHPRKNLGRIIKAYEKFRQSSTVEYKLLVVGSTKYWTDDTRLAFEKSPFRRDIHLLGRQSDETVHRLLAASEALIYASLFEGFGIPILEAFRCDTQVIASNCTSMPEVGGKAALYVDPYSIDSISDAMLKVYQDTKGSDIRREEARHQLEKFTWQQTAKKLWDSIEKTYEPFS